MRVVISQRIMLQIFEIKAKTYFTLLNIDAAKALRRHYDADDRIFKRIESLFMVNVYAQILVLMPNLNQYELDNRFLLIMNGMFIHRAAKGYSHGLEWVGLKLSHCSRVFIPELRSALPGVFRD